MGKARQLKRLKRSLMANVIHTLGQGPAPPSKTYLTDDHRSFTHSEVPSLAWEPMTFKGMVSLPPHTTAEGLQTQTMEEWVNAHYTVSVRRRSSGFPIDDAPYIILGISHVSETAHRDFRDFQRIKNDVCGEEWEGLELYPSESRLVDPSNRSYIWCVPPGVIQWGLDVPGRRVLTMKDSIAPQRPFHDE